MKTISKYLFILAAAVFTFTACEKQTEREPSPAGNPNAIAFEAGNIYKEINPVKAALEYEIKVARTSSEAELSATIHVEGDIDIINVPTTVKFAAGENEAVIKLTFPNAQVDSTYSVVLSIDSVNKSPYADGNSTCTFTVAIAAWEPAATQAIVFDGIVNVFYSTGNPGWYVNYLRKDNVDGSFDIRLLNPYTVLPDYLDGNYDAPIQDQFGLYKGFPYNYPEDVDSKGTYNMDVHVDAEGNATFDTFAMGMTWSNGDFWGAHATSKGLGVFDATTNTITFAGGTVACGMSAYNDGAFYIGKEPLIIYLDAQAYQNDHLSVADFNDPSIEWEEIESAVNQFESTIFSFLNEEQKLYKAVDQYPGNPKSPFINLYCLKDVYAEGGNLAFYWDGEDGAITIPTPQDTKLSFMKQELIIAEAAGKVATANVKGTDVQVFTFQLHIVSEMGNDLGIFTETFSLADEAIIFAKEDFIGDFTMVGYSQFTGDAESVAVSIAEEEGNLVLHGITYCSGLLCDFDAEKGTLSVAPQVQDSIAGTYDIAFYTTTADGVSTKAALEFGFGLSGIAKLTASSEADGYLVRSEVAGGWLAGHYDLTLTPGAPAAAPARTPAIDGARSLKNHAFKAANTPGVSHLKFNGKYHRQRTIKSNLVRF